MKKGCLDNPVEIGGLTPLTTIDYPGELAAVLFLQGCPWRCGYCHNQELMPRRSQFAIPWSRVIELLEQRVGLLDAVVFSGGEPTLQAGLEEAMHRVKSLGFKIGLHTAGIYPERLQAVLPLVDWIGMDIKSTRAQYEATTGVRGSGARAWRSAELIVDSGVACEFRTTLHPDMLSQEQLMALASELSESGATSYVVQKCNTGHCRDEAWRLVSQPVPDRQFFAQIAEKFDDFSLRNY
jgi:anaerobic ribonucleoside-triphosphate reductase activating protein